MSKSKNKEKVRNLNDVGNHREDLEYDLIFDNQPWALPENQEFMRELKNDSKRQRRRGQGFRSE